MGDDGQGARWAVRRRRLRPAHRLPPRRLLRRLPERRRLLALRPLLHT